MSNRVSAFSGSGPFAFVSYSHRDSRTVYPIIEQLTRMGYNIWYDEGIPLVSDYGGVLYDRIKSCSVFVLFVSESSVRSEDVQKEAAHAISFKKPIVQVVIDETAELPSALAYHLPKSQQYLPISCEPREFYSKLTAALSACQGQMQEAAVSAKSAPHTPASSSLKVGDKMTFGRFRQSGTQPEPIEWRVLKVEHDRALVISELALAHMKFSENWLTGSRWQTSTLREWLNGYFLKTAFTADERERIVTARLQNPNVQGECCDDPTEDKVFCLSLQEAGELFADNSQRAARMTEAVRDSFIFKPSDGPCRWWLRTMGKSNSLAVIVNNDGGLYTNGYDVSGKQVYVRPALFISLR